ncbi:hypothetical protein MJO29_004193, partial [Puccinia striiformis f. sp. tritici]
SALLWAVELHASILSRSNEIRERRFIQTWEGINITEMISLLNIANNDEPVVDALKEQLSTQFLLSRSYLVFRGVQ